MKLTTASQIITTVAWTAILTAAILIKQLALPPQTDTSLGANIETGLVLVFTFLTVGVRIVPGFRQGILGTISSLFSGRGREVPPASMDVPGPNQTNPNEAKTTDHTETTNEGMQDVEVGVEQKGQQPERLNHQQRQSSVRVYFLDWIKVFLTAVVVVHHVTCVFKGEGGSMPIAIGMYENKFQDYAGWFTGINQGYFMSLFFFISAYFTPRSYDKKGSETFLYERALRLFIPGLLVTFGIYPLGCLIAQLAAGVPTWYTGYTFLQDIFVLSAGPTWFVFWLLIFSYAYHTFRQAYTYADKLSAAKTDTMDNQETEGPAASVFPCWWKRIVAGATICGLLLYAFKFKMIGGAGNFYTMPVWTGSASCDVLFFAVGIYACRQNWMTSPILPSWASWAFICIAVPLEYFLGWAFAGNYWDNQIVSFLFYGMYCVDMSTVMLALFQRFVNFKPGKFGKFLSSSAYTVYLIHPVVLTAWTGVFVKVYNAIYDEVIEFGGPSPIAGHQIGAASSSHLLGPGDGSLALFVGWLLVSALSLLTVWPLAYGIRSIPFLIQIL